MWGRCARPNTGPLCSISCARRSPLIAAATSDAVIEEAADVLEVLTAIAAWHGGTLDNIVGVARSKRAERGGFDMRLWLDGVDAASP